MQRSSLFGIPTVLLPLLFVGLSFYTLNLGESFALQRIRFTLKRRLDSKDPSSCCSVPSCWTIQVVKRPSPTSAWWFMEKAVYRCSSPRLLAGLSSSSSFTPASCTLRIPSFPSYNPSTRFENRRLAPVALPHRTTQQSAVSRYRKTMTIHFAQSSTPKSSSFRELDTSDERYGALGGKSAPIHADSADGTEATRMSSFLSTEDTDDNSGGDNDSLEALQLRIQALVERYQQQPSSKSSNSLSLVCAIAGGGGHFLSTLSATPGASKILLQGNILYNREAFDAYLRQHPSSSEGSIKDSNSPQGKLRYASMAAAQRASVAALQQASQLLAMDVTTSAARRRSKAKVNGDSALSSSRALSELSGATGVGCASVLQTTVNNATGSSSGNSESRAYVVVTRQDGQQLALSVALADNGNRNRFQEDVFVAHCIVTCLDEALLQRCSDQNGGAASTSKANRNRPSLWTDTTISGDVLDFSAIRNDNSSPLSDPPRDVVEEAASRVLSQKCSVVGLIPTHSDGDENSNASFCFSLLTSVALPSSSLVFPGSFNPVHQGHAQLAQAALQATTSFPSSDVVWFELALTNADKPPLAVADVQQRVRCFAEFFAQHGNAFDFAWGILLTNAPLFKQKVELLQPLVVPTSATTHGNSHIALLDMIVGTDTLVRLLDAKYYNNSRHQMLQALQDMPCRFIVGGRVASSPDSSSPVFLSGREQIESLPADLQTKFMVIQEEDFRVDISSTELRRRQQATMAAQTDP